MELIISKPEFDRQEVARFGGTHMQSKLCHLPNQIAFMWNLHVNIYIEILYWHIANRF